MAFLTLNGHRVLRGIVSMPFGAAWTVTAHVDELTIDDGAAVKLEGSSLGLSGTARPGLSGSTRAALHVAAVGGAGKLATEIDAQAYRMATVGLIVSHILRDAGEQLSSTSTPETLNTTLAAWVRHKGPAGTQLRAVLEEIGAAWTVLDDGSIWVGTPTWPAAPQFPFTIVEERPREGRIVIAADVAQLRPGMTFLGRRVVNVVHTFESSRFRTEVEFSTADGGDRLWEKFQRIVRHATRHVPYFGRYAGKVVEQTASRLVGVWTDAEEIAHTPPVPIRPGLPGFQVKVPHGTRASVAFENGDPQKPVVVGFEEGGAGDVTELVFADGTKGAARVDDAIDAGYLVFTGSPFSGVLYFGPGALPDPAPAGAVVHLTGKVTSGSAKLKVG